MGLLSFADDVRVEFALTTRGNENESAYKEMVRKVRGLQTRGMTAFYSACLQATEATQALPRVAAVLGEEHACHRTRPFCQLEFR